MVWEHAWFDAFRNLVKEDLDTARMIRARVNALAEDPAPDDSVRWGTSNFYRLHMGNWRVLYEVVDDTVRVWSLGRTRAD